jgi:cytochrome c6
MPNRNSQNLPLSRWAAFLLQILVISGLLFGGLGVELVGIGPSPAWAIEAAPAPTAAGAGAGAALFETNCAGCHAGGGNIIRRGKSLKLKALKKNGRASVELIADIVTHGKANMSAYGDRLTPAEITLLSNYVWEQAQIDWKPQKG